MKRLLSALMVLALLLLYSGEGWSADFPRGLICAFLVENSRSGKPNEATCAMSPEHVFSSQRYPYTGKPWEHCDVNRIYAREEWRNFKVDLKNNIVTFRWVYQLSDYAKPRQRKFYIKEGDTAEEANRKINSVRMQDREYDINFRHLSKRRIYVDPITKEHLNPPKTVPQYMIGFGDEISEYVLHYAKGIPETIITSPKGNGTHSWINMRFGKCRIRN